ncbi:MAG: pyruvate dehydrogenase [Nitrospirae bacterium]|nr:pyruvate dehydrogenase [Nitrospirota bacterium]
MEDLNDFLLKAYTIRCTEETLLDLYRKGKLFGTTHTCVGQEFSALAVANALNDEDVIFSNHRCHGHYIAKTNDIEGLLAEIMGKSNGICGGIGGSQHLCGRNFFSNGVQGGIAPVAAGMALGQKLDGKDTITVVCIGDGTLGQGVVYETMNMASKWALPLLIVLEDNGYSQSTSQHETLSGSIAGRASAFGIKVFEGNTWEYEKLIADMKRASDHVRKECEPVFFRVLTYRLRAHSKGDDHRDINEIRDYEEKDPLNIFLNEYKDDEAIKEKLRQAADRIKNAVEKAEQSEFAGLNAARTAFPDLSSLKRAAKSGDTQLKAINKALSDGLKEDSRIILLGEDIRMPYGGAFKVTKGLSDDFPGRVLNTPISEAGIVGIGNGLALAGYKPVIEIMFGDFITLSFDQLVNHAAKFRHMYNDQVSVPLIVRTPMGAGRGYGPTHSQSLEKHIVGVPGLNIYILHHRVDIARFYSELFKNIKDPSVIIENKVLYAVKGDREATDEFEVYETDEAYPTTVVKSDGEPDVTICAFGRMALLAEEAAEVLYRDEEILVELIFPLSVSPLNISAVFDSVKKTRKLIVVEEGTSFFNLGAEVIARINEEWDDAGAFISRRVSPGEIPIPCSGPMEKECLPSKETIIDCCKEIFSV